MGSEGEENEEQGSSEESPKSNGILAAPRPPPAQPPAIDYQQLYDALWEDNERLKEQLQEAELKVTQLRLELERVTQRQERIAERPALLELERVTQTQVVTRHFRLAQSAKRQRRCGRRHGNGDHKGAGGARCDAD